jgi:integral membrane sensor domain MASE1
MAEVVINNQTRKQGTVVARSDAALRDNLLLAVLVFASYYSTSKIGFAFALQPGSVSILWMPNSILLAALLLTSRRWWWLVL